MKRLIAAARTQLQILLFCVTSTGRLENPIPPADGIPSTGRSPSSSIPAERISGPVLRGDVLSALIAFEFVRRVSPRGGSEFRLDCNFSATNRPSSRQIYLAHDVAGLTRPCTRFNSSGVSRRIMRGWAEPLRLTFCRQLPRSFRAQS